MDNIKKGDPITADWANALINAFNGTPHGKTTARGGGGGNVSISPYQRGSRPLAFDLVKITDDNDSSLSGKISGGLLFYAAKEEDGVDENGDKKFKLSTGKIEITELESSFKSTDKVWVEVSYDEETWKPSSATLKNGGQVPGASPGKAYFLVGEFESRNNSIIYKHKGLTCIIWDAIKWDDYKLKTNPACALELTKQGEEHELTLNIESSSEEEDLTADSDLKVWLVQKKGKGAGGAEEGPVKLGVRIKDSRSFQKVQPGAGLEWEMETDQDGNEIQTEIIRVKIDSTDVSSPEPGKWPVKLEATDKGLKGNLDLTVDTTEHDLGGGGKISLSNATAGVLSLSVTSGSFGENLSFMMPLRKSNNHVLLDYDRNWVNLSNDKIRFHNLNGTLTLDVESVDAPAGGCDCNYALSESAESSSGQSGVTISLTNNGSDKGKVSIQFTSSNGSIIIS